MIIVAGAGDECVCFFIVMLMHGGSVVSYSQALSGRWFEMTFSDMHGCI